MPEGGEQGPQSLPDIVCGVWVRLMGGGPMSGRWDRGNAVPAQSGANWNKDKAREGRGCEAGSRKWEKWYRTFWKELVCGGDGGV